MPLLPQNRTLRWLLIFAVTAGVLAIGWSLWSLYAANSFASRIAAIRAAGDPASLADLAPKPVPKEEDAAAYLAAIKPQLDAFEADVVRFLKTPLGEEYAAADDKGQRPSSEQIEAMRSILEKYGDVDAAIEKAADCNQYASQLDFSLPHQQFLAGAIDSWSDFRGVARFVTRQIDVAIADGQYDQAVDRGIQLLKLAQLHNAEPSLTASLVGFAVRGVAAHKVYEALSAGPVSEHTRQRLDDELDRFEKEPGFTETIKSERAISISAAQANFSGIRGLLVSWPRPANASVLDVYDDLIPLANRPQPRIQARGIASLIVPALEAWFEAANRTTAIMRSLRVYNELQKQERSNPHQPASLAALEMPEEVTLDPFCGAPLKIKQKRGGWSVYSVGKEGKDEGGSVHDGKDYGVGPRDDGE